jgi:superoxide dismutase, Cu-Zn family
MRKTLLAIVSLAVLSGWTLAQAADPPKHQHDEEAPAKVAVCVISPTEGHKANGVLTLTQTDQGVQVTGEIKGLRPGEHGFHIHEFGDLRSPDGTALGGHYNPHGMPHAGPQDKQHHEGDLGNVKANGEGVTQVSVLAEGLKLHFIIGRSIVVHADPDDLKTQKPPGNAGARIGVGVIGVANPAIGATAKK